MPLGAEEFYGRSPPQVDLSGVIGQNTDRTVRQINLASEENVANKRDQFGALAKAPNNAAQGYMQGRRFASEEDRSAQQLQMGQQQMQEGQQRMGMNEQLKQARGLDMEQQRAQMGDEQRKRDFMTQIDPKTGKSFESEESGARHSMAMQEPGFRSEEHALSMRQGNAQIGASGAQQALAGYQLKSAQHTDAVGNAGEEFKAALASGDQGQINAVNAKYGKIGLDATDLARAQMLGKQALASGGSARDLLVDNSNEGINAHARLTDLDGKVAAATQLQADYKEYSLAGYGTEAQAIARSHIQNDLHSLGMHKEAEDIGSMTGGVDPGAALHGQLPWHTEGARVDGAYQSAINNVKSQYQQVVAQHGTLGSGNFQNRLKDTGKGIEYLGTSAGNMSGNPDILGGGNTPGAGMTGQNKQFTQGQWNPTQPNAQKLQMSGGPAHNQNPKPSHGTLQLNPQQFGGAPQQGPGGPQNQAGPQQAPGPQQMGQNVQQQQPRPSLKFLSTPASQGGTP